MLSFLVVGHTKFSPDWCFGLLKQRFRRTNVGCLDDIVQVVDDSAKVNVAKLVGSQEGEKIVPTYNWSGMFQGHLRKLPQIKKYHHFRFDASTPGCVHYRCESDSDEHTISLVQDHTWLPSQNNTPDNVAPIGLSLERW